MQLGSHDTMTYAKPTKWWMYPIRFMARCQSKTIQEQYDLGARMFDLRMKFTNDGKPYFAHGLIDYDEPVAPILTFLNEKGCDVRFLLEHKAGVNEKYFINFCQMVRRRYPNIKAFGGRNKYTWEEVFKFKYKGPTYLDKYSSNNTDEEGKPITGTYLDDWFPWIYAATHNKKNIEAGTDRDYLLIDFVEIQ